MNCFEPTSLRRVMLIPATVSTEMSSQNVYHGGEINLAKSMYIRKPFAFPFRTEGFRCHTGAGHRPKAAKVWVVWVFSLASSLALQFVAFTL